MPKNAKNNNLIIEMIIALNKINSFKITNLKL